MEIHRALRAERVLPSQRACATVLPPVPLVLL
jgi:hypothetical protein